jgi:hypothetical protein
MTDKIYKIRRFDESTGQIIISVEGYHSLIAIDLSLDENNNVPTGEDLHRYINGFVPYSWIERSEKLKNGITNKQSILDLLEPLPENDVAINNTEDCVDCTPTQSNDSIEPILDPSSF